MNRQILIQIIADALRAKFTPDKIKRIQDMLNQGMFMTVFPEAVNKAVVDGIAETFKPVKEGE